ncbi:RNA polymerase sigma factor [Sporosarcina gallistercoris]|uniref:Sigma-70 family RNA polymerase sigma factor n=1 Tax=Sporosarcina gallistercoris TaxID=2762245 RepID=A0ABR8PIU7_9BACL|nr:sigma-70 family RNA polymerase sigma factor [Sporosarcina gallistercoris]MBD7908080.1 sigma-70 family RNA polymerase sigma factor [Sporosarcina gallistercoris]
MKHTDDGTLYALAAAKDRSAFEILYDRYEKLIFSFAYRITQDREIAEEVVQDVFVKLWNGTTTYQEQKGSFSSWLLTVTRNKAFDEIRRLKRHDHEPMLEKDALIEQLGDVEKTVEWSEQRNAIRNAVLELKQEQQEIIDLFYFKGLSQQKIADQCELPLGTVKGRIRLALKHLKGFIAQEGGFSND